MTERTAFADVGISWAEVTPIGLIEDPFSEPTFAELSAAGPRLMALEQALPWIIGDWLLYGEAKWGEMYTQAMDVTHYSYSRLSTFVYVCRAVPYDRRRTDLSFGHHEVVAPLEPDQRHRWRRRSLSRRRRAWSPSPWPATPSRWLRRVGPTAWRSRSLARNGAS